MNIHDSYWLKSTQETQYDQLNKSLNVDAIIVGGGITGITTAWLLQKEGLKTAVIEANKVGHGATGYTTAKITSQHNLIYSYLIDNFGTELALQYAQANQSGLEFIREMVEKYNMPCDFETQCAYIYTTNDDNIGKINKELVAALSLGLPAEFVDNTDLPYDIYGGIRFRDQGQFHPIKYLYHIARLYREHGGAIFENTKAKDIDIATNVVTTDRFQVKADNIIISSHYPFFSKGHLYSAKMTPNTSYIVAIEGKNLLKRGMYISCDKDTRSFRHHTSNDEDLLLIGGQNHQTGHAKNENNNYKILEEFANDIYHDIKVKYHWCTQDYVTIDRVPYIGYLSEKYKHIFVATGFGKWGMTSSSLAGLLIKDLILTENSKWFHIFNPARHFTLDSSKTFYSDTINSGVDFIRSKLKGKMTDIDLIPLNEGKILKIKNKKVGIYKNSEGELYIVDSTCPHMKCEVSFNNAEKTWDCPCHGSRFQYDGSFIDGPANQDLKRLNLEDIYDKDIEKDK